MQLSKNTALQVPQSCLGPVTFVRQNSYEFQIEIQLSQVVGVTGLEPVTPRLSSACSNQLSYTPRRPGRNFKFEIRKLVELRRLELLTYSLQSYRSTN